MTIVWVLLGAAVGAPLRYLTDLLVQSRHDSVLPWGTVTVNVAGSVVLGVTACAMAGEPGPAWVLPLVGTGFCGALTTFSTFAFETVRLMQEEEHRAAAVNVAVSLVCCLAGCAVGWGVGSALA